MTDDAGLSLSSTAFDARIRQPTWSLGVSAINVTITSVPPPALTALATLLDDVDSLLRKHPKATKPGRGRPNSDEGPLKRACVALCYTAWEVYVEDSLIWVAERAARLPTPDHLPDPMRSFLQGNVKDPWQLAGHGWRQALIEAVTARTRGSGDRGSGGLNTAGPGQVTELHKDVLGESLLAKCRWQGKTNPSIRRDLAQLVSIRGAIVHRGETPGSLSLGGVRDWRNFIKRTGEHLDRHTEGWADANLAASLPE